MPRHSSLVSPNLTNPIAAMERSFHEFLQKCNQLEESYRRQVNDFEEKLKDKVKLEKELEEYKQVK